jgi:transposase-like protein
MSATVDQQRREEALHARVERGRERLAMLQRLLQLELEGVTVSEMARRLDVHTDTARAWRSMLVGRGWHPGVRRAT